VVARPRYHTAENVGAGGPGARDELDEPVVHLLGSSPLRSATRR
jgi:hypothetical protein